MLQSVNRRHLYSEWQPFNGYYFSLPFSVVGFELHAYAYASEGWKEFNEFCGWIQIF